MKTLRCPGTINRPCRYELPEAGFSASGEIVCPECGRKYAGAPELSRRIRFKRNVWTLIACAVVMMGLLGAGSYVLYTMDWPEDYRSAILIRRMPETGLADSAVFQELETRARFGSLSKSHQQRLLVAIESALTEDPDAWWPLASLVMSLNIGTPETVALVIEGHPRTIRFRDASRIVWWMGAMPSEAVAGELLAIAEGRERLGQVYRLSSRFPGPLSSIELSGLAMGQLCAMRSHLTPDMVARIERMETYGHPFLQRYCWEALGRCPVCGDDMRSAASELCPACEKAFRKEQGGG